MEITIKNLEFIERSIKAKDVFKRETLLKVYLAIKNDFEDDILEGWSGTTKEELGYDWKTVEGDLRLERNAIDYALYASELSLYDFLQEFADYVDEDYDEYEKFVENVKEGKYKLVASKDLT